MSAPPTAGVVLCPNCGEENPGRFRLCGFCGTELALAAAREIRRTVTIVFCDLKGSTSLGEKLDSESLRALLNRYFSTMQRVVERHGGTVEKFIGDAVMAVFGLPRVREDDALRAVRAASDMQRALLELNEDLRAGWGVTLANRIGVNTGEVVAGDVTSGQRLVTGDAVNVAARLEQAAPEMAIFVGESTYALVRDAVDVEPPIPLELKGKAEPVNAFGLISVVGGEGRARRHDAPMVGRVAELEALHRAFRDAVDAGRPRLFTILGQAGVGKSRLLLEFSSVVGARILRGRTLPYGEGVTFWPVAEMIREAAGITDADRPDEARARIVRLLEGLTGADDVHVVADRAASVAGLLPSDFRMEETFWGIRKLFGAIAARGPLVLVFDDLHWAEPTLLDLVEHVAASDDHAPILLVGTARPDLLEERAGWSEASTGGAIHLEPLSPDESAKVVANLLGSSDFPTTLRDRIVRSAEGNPLFVEQLLQMLVDDGSIRREDDGRWVPVGDVTALPMPPTISALLAARLERLTDDERAVVDRASVIGQAFNRSAIEALSAGRLDGRVEALLDSLERKQMVRRGGARTYMGEDAFRFHHLLIRDAVYGALLKRTRAELHEAYGEHLERASGQRAAELEEILGYHFEQAYQLLRELGSVGDHVHGLGARASARLASAGRHALARGDAHAAANLLSRAADVLPKGGRARSELLPDLAQAHTEAGSFLDADVAASEALGFAVEQADELLEARATEVQLYLRFLAQGEGFTDRVVAELHRIVPVFERAGDHRSLARTCALLGYVHGTASRFEQAEAEVGRALEHARLAGDRREEARNLSAYAQSALYGPMPVGEAIERCEALMKEASYDHRASSMILLSLARLYAMAGDVEHARELYAGSRAISQDLGARLHAALASIDAGPIELMAGDLAAAERELRRDYAALEEIGERAYLSTTAAWLAHVLFEAGRLDEAEAQSRVSESLATADDTETQVLWRCALGKVLAARGRGDEAEALVREAVDRIEATDQVDAQGLALTDLGRVLSLAPGRDADAMEAFERAIERFDRKGNVVSSARATALRQQARAAVRPALRLEQLRARDDRPGVVATPTTSRS